MATVKGAGSVRRYLSAAPDRLTGILRGAARAGGRVIADDIARRTPSSDVRDNLRVRTRRGDGQVKVRIDVKPGWARSVGTWLEYGTTPHFISVDDRQRGGRSIGRINRQANDEGGHSLIISGQFVGATVFHPGARPHPAFRPAIDAQEGAAVAAAQQYLNARLRGSGLSDGDDGDGE